jgi:hypothetical protein
MCLLANFSLVLPCTSNAPGIDDSSIVDIYVVVATSAAGGVTSCTPFTTSAWTNIIGQVHFNLGRY